MTIEEEPLHGGRVTAGVVRVGDTVRRPMVADRSLRHALLEHLERQGFEGTPRFLGVDDQDREILSFLPGEVPDDLGHFDDAQLTAAAGLLRSFHDATTDLPQVRQHRAEVICHNDWGPTNAVFRDGLPYALIDFDTIAPGSRLWDLGYSAFVWLDLGNTDYTGEEQARRVSVFATGYGRADCPAPLIATHAVARQTALAASAAARGLDAMADWASAAAAWTVTNLGPASPPPR